jgi:conjugative transposon TraM protein
MNTNNSQTDERKSGLSGGQKQQLKKYAVFTLMGIICASCMWFIFTPSADEKAGQEAQTGFNAEIPDPKSEGIIGDKVTAYEQEQMKQKQEERMRSLEDFSSLLGENSKKQTDGLALLPDETPRVNGGVSTTPQSTPVQNSVNAYRNINRTLGNFYETPKSDPEKERLLAELDELRDRLDRQEQSKNAVDEQMAVMEKSFQMASKYLPMSSATTISGTMQQNQSEGTVATKGTDVSGKTLAVPVSQFVEQTVSALPQEMSGKEVIHALAQPRNLGFFTATTGISTQRKNTLSACIHADQTLTDGESVRLRLLEPMRAGNTHVRENTVLSGFTKIQGERLQITVNSIEYNGNIIPVEMSVYDTDGQRGIFIPDTKEINAAKEIAANMGTNAGTSISLSSDAGKQFAADMGRSVVQGVSQFFSRKMREVKVSLKAGYRVFLLPEGNVNSTQLAGN